MRVTIWVYWCYFSGGEDKKNDLGVEHQLQYESDTADVLSLFKVAQNSNRKQNHIEDSSSNCKYNNPISTKIDSVPNFEQQISHQFPMFFFPKKKWIAPSCWGHVSSKPFLLGGLERANWTKPWQPWLIDGPFMEPPWLVKLGVETPTAPKFPLI